jgi:muramoyltetrapeptide carboxypeptidase
MKRKDFLSSIIPMGAVFSNIATGKLVLNDPGASSKIPPYLKKGDIIGICCIAGYITLEDVKPSVDKIKEWGFDIKPGYTIGKKDFTFGGTDQERLNDLQQMLDDKNIKAILCARGGYGSIRIIDKLNFTKFIAHPKWIIGFSDATVLHSHINRNFGIATIHSKMCNSFPDDWSKADADQIVSIDSIRKSLTGEKMEYSIPSSEKNKTGVGHGTLIGGNLKTLETLADSVSDINTDGKILFVEDKDEYLYSIDRMFWNLKRSGKLDNLKGLIIGGFKTMKDDVGEEFGMTLEEIVLEKITDCDYPVCFDFPVGHQKNNMALKCGIMHKLIVADSICTLTEIK